MPGYSLDQVLRIIPTAKQYIRNKRIGELSLQPQDIQGIMEEIFKYFSTLQSQASNRNEEIAAREGLPGSTVASMNRGTAMQLGQLGEQQLANLQLQQKKSRIDAIKYLDQLELQKERLKQLQEQQDKDLLASIFSTLGSSLPFVGGLF